MIGNTLGHYRILDLLGEGGMGTVYRAEDGKLHRSVALKVLPEALAQDPERLSRFRREAELLAALDHPNIVTVYSVEEVDGVHFLTMALVEGESLEDRIPLGGLPVDDLLDIAGRLADGLAAAHEKGITHRDLKPANVMITPEGDLKVLDFGVAKSEATTGGAKDAAELATRTLTEAGKIVGTIPYMSPEQLQGQTVDPRSDIFSLGVVLYEMATGERPFDKASPVDLASSIVHEDPQPIESSRTDIPRHLGRIVNQCLAKDPGDRFQTARGVSNQLRTLQKESGEQTAASDAARIPESGRATEASGRSYGRMVAIVVVLVAIAGVSGWLASRARYEPGTVPDSAAAPARQQVQRVAVLPFENLGPAEDAYIAAGITEEINSRLAAVHGLSVRSRGSVLGYDRSGKTMPEVGRELGVDYILDGTLRWARGTEGGSRIRITPQLIRVSDDIPLWTESYDRVLDDAFALQSEIAGKVLDSLGLTLMESELARSELRGTDDAGAFEAFLRGEEALRNSGETFAAEPLGEALDHYGKAIEIDPDFALAWAKSAMAHAFLAHWYVDRTDARIASLREAADRALELAPGLPEAHLALSYYYRMRLEYDLALKELELARSGRPGESDVLRAIAEFHMYRGDAASAQAAYRQASELDPNRAEIYCMWGGSHRFTGDPTASRELHRRAHTLRSDRACSYYCISYVTLEELGVEAARGYLETVPHSIVQGGRPPLILPWLLVETAQGRHQEALDRLRAVPSEAMSFYFFYYPKSLLEAQLLTLLERPAEARERFETARGLLEVLARERPGDPRIHSSLGIAWAGLGDKQRALAAGREAIRLLPIEKDSYTAPYRYKDLATIQTMVGDYDDAIASLETLFSHPAMMEVSMVTLDPLFAPLSDDTRFQSLEKTRLPAA